MRKKSLLLPGLLITGLFCSAVGAMSIGHSLLNGQCSSLPGQWHGKGKVKAWLVSCEYEGTGEVTGTNNFSMKLAFHRTKGPSACPGNQDMTLTGECRNGHIEVHNNEVDVSGDLEDSNRRANLSGDVKFSRLKANLKVELSR